MTATTNLHDANLAEWSDLSPANGRPCASLTFRDAHYNRVTLFVPPHVAEVVAATFNAAMRSAIEVPMPAETAE